MVFCRMTDSSTTLRSISLSPQNRCWNKDGRELELYLLTGHALLALLEERHSMSLISRRINSSLETTTKAMQDQSEMSLSNLIIDLMK